jgi:hypothetical protein
MLLAGARWAAALGSSGCPSTASATSAAAAARAPGDGPRSCHQIFSVARKKSSEASSAKGNRVHQQRSYHSKTAAETSLRNLLVPSKTYQFRAEACIKFSCLLPSDGQLSCRPKFAVLLQQEIVALQ